MKKATIVIYEGTIAASSTGGYSVTTNPEANTALASAEKVALHLQFDPASAVGLGAPVVTPQQSSDGITFIDMNALTLTPTAASIDNTRQSNYHGALTGSTPALDGLRFMISGSSTATATCRCRVWATLRDDA